MSIKEVTEVCRLCLKNENLVWVFDKRFENTENMKDVIFITTGVEINLKDFITQKICTKCLQITIKIYQFRETSLKNDTLLKNKHKELVKNGSVNIPSTSNEIKRETSVPKTETKSLSNLSEFVHPSVKKLIKAFPNFVLPKSCFQLNIAPYVSMPMNEVENYFKKRNINMKTQILYALQALKAGKKTSDERVKTENQLPLKTRYEEYQDIKRITSVSPVDTKSNTINYSENNETRPLKSIFKSDLKRTLSSSDCSSDCDNSNNVKKRRLSNASSSSEKKGNAVSTTNNFQGSGTTPEKATTETAPVQVSYVEKTIEICDICNSVHYNIRDLKKHQLKHLRCQFCKAKFKTMELKEIHIQEHCIIKKTMNPSNLPSINLTRVELILGMRLKYPDAFASFPLVSILAANESLSKNKENNDSLDTTRTEPEHGSAESQVNTAIDVIEILSDDEEVAVNSLKKDSIVHETDKLNKSVEPSNTIPSSSTNDSFPQNDLQELSTVTPINQTLVHNEDLPNLSSSIVKPDIRIKNNYILDGLDPKATDMMVLKELLKSYRKMQLKRDTAVQSELPSNTSIVTNLSDFTTNLKNLKHHLHIYKIPVEVKKGNYKVSFDYTPKSKKIKTMAEWKHLRPLDLKVPINNTSSSEHTPVVTSNSSNITQRLSGPFNTSVSQTVHVTSPPSYNSHFQITSSSNSMNKNVNKTQTVSYQHNSSMVAQLKLIPNNSQTFIINQSNNGLSYDQNNTVYNTNNTLYNTANTLYNTNNTLYSTNNTVYNTNNHLYSSSGSVIMPNSVPQVIVSSTPVYPTSILNSSSVSSVPVVSAPSSVVLLPSSASTPLTDTSVSYSNVEPTIPLQSFNNISSAGTIPSQSMSTASIVTNYSSNKLLRNLPSETIAPSASSSLPSMPLIRVKDLLELK